MALHLSIRDLLVASYACLPGHALDYERLKQDYPWIEFIGLVGFDTHRQEFVLVEVKNDETSTHDQRALSTREQEILRLVIEGCTNAQIARELNISENTVKAHMQSIFAKLKVSSRTQAAMHAVQHGWVTG